MSRWMGGRKGGMKRGRESEREGGIFDIQLNTYC